jgi:ubiquinone/menaquinone biosynthesis C-methylase UbiE
MSFYGTHIFPRLMDWVMSGSEFGRLRADLLREVRGEVLEIGFGTGLNLAYYPAGLSRLSAVDPARALSRRVARRIAAVPFPVEQYRAPAERLPFTDRRFDWVVTTWTLCSVADPLRALAEARRVLKRGGRLRFLEHGRSADPRTAAWQHRLNPIQNVIGCGCHLNRPIDQLIRRSGFRIMRLERFRMEHVPRIAGETYRGTAEVLSSDGA